jgi:hypothetical protein
MTKRRNKGGIKVIDRKAVIGVTWTARGSMQSAVEEWLPDMWVHRTAYMAGLNTLNT